MGQCFKAKFKTCSVAWSFGSVPGGGGRVLSGKVGTGMCGPDRVLFRALRFCNGPFFI